MPQRILLPAAALLMASLAACRGDAQPDWALVVHGGAGTHTLIEYTDEERAARREAFEAALRAGQDVLQTGGSALDAVQAAVRVLEDAPGYNAGRGSVLTHDGHAELDASIMDGDGRRAGAVAGVRRVRNPADLARLVMEQSRHVFLIGEGAERFARDQGVALVDPDYFITERRREELRRLQEDETAAGAADDWARLGTVGAVALDRRGHLAAATSTGGMTNKRHGRIGDSPIIAAGTYAENGVCAVSATGWGEYFIRHAVAYDLCARIKHRGSSVRQAAQEVIDEVTEAGGFGGVIALDSAGKFAMPYSTPRMVHGYSVAGQPAEIFMDEDRTAYDRAPADDS